MNDYREPNILYLIFGIILIVFGIIIFVGTLMRGYWDSGSLPWIVFM